MSQVFTKGAIIGILANIIEESKVIIITMAPRISPGIKTRLLIMPVTGSAMPVATKGLDIEPRPPEPIAEKKGAYVIMLMPLHRPMVREYMTISIPDPMNPPMGSRYHSIWYCQGSNPKVSIWFAGSLAIKAPMKLPVNSKGALWPEGGWVFLYIVFIES
jgi:hypothetical protein